MKKDITVSMIGLGYIGLPTAALIASKGIQVHGVDLNSKAVNTINEGKIHIVEPDLEGLVDYVVKKKLLSASEKNKESDVFLIAVPTPFKGSVKENKIPTPDLTYVEKAIDSIIPFLKEGNLIIVESTCPVGTTENISKRIFSKRLELKNRIYIAYCPERVLPGQIVYELEHNDRSIGGIDEASSKKAIEFYSLFVKGKLHFTNSRTAELCKLTENAFRDVNIAFANELSMICDNANIDVRELINLTNKHPRVNILQPGPGVGGHCIAVDPWFIVSDYPDDARIMKLARDVNNGKEEWVLGKIIEKADEFQEINGRAPVIACMGLAYKPDIDDLRESPSLEIYLRLNNELNNVLFVEPNINSFEGAEPVDMQEAIEAADIIVFLVSHKEFKYLVINKDKIVLDFCGAL